MPRPKTDQRWRDAIRNFTANEPALSSSAIHTRLAEMAAKQGRDDCPSERTIRRILNEFPGLPQEQQIEYSHLAWPRVAEQGAMPWEASRAVLALLGFCRVRFADYRPTVHLGKWFWRTTLAAPDLDADRRFGIALDLATLDAGQPADTWTGGLVETPSEHRLRIEEYLAYAPWQSEDSGRAYRLGHGGLEPYDPLLVVGGFAEIRGGKTKDKEGTDGVQTGQ